MPWQAGALQAVLFLEQTGVPAAPDALQPWLQVFRVSPQSYQQNPPGGPLVAQASGTLGNFQAALQAQPGRFDLTLTPLNTPGAELPLIADVASALEVLTLHAHRLIEGKAVVRAACVLQLAQRVGSPEEGVSLVKTHVPLEAVPANATEIEIAFNIRKRLRSIDGLEMNRLCRWNTGIQQLFQVQINLDGTSRAVASNAINIVGFSVDVNSVPQSTPFEVSRTVLVFDELVDEARRIMMEGYEGLSNA